MIAEHACDDAAARRRIDLVDQQDGEEGIVPSGRIPICPESTSWRPPGGNSTWCEYGPAGGWIVSGLRAVFTSGEC